MTTITDGYTSFTPTLVVGADSKLRSTNRVHQLLGGKIAVTLGEAQPRAGTLGILIHGEADKDACVRLHTPAAVFQLIEPGRPSYNMTYVLAEGGSIAVEQYREHDDLWMISIDFQEVTE